MPTKKKYRYNTQCIEDQLTRKRTQYQRLPTLFEKAFELHRMTKMNILLITKDDSGNIVKFGCEPWLNMYEAGTFTPERVGESRQWHQDNFRFFPTSANATLPTPSTTSTDVQVPTGNTFRNNL